MINTMSNYIQQQEFKLYQCQQKEKRKIHDEHGDH